MIRALVFDLDGTLVDHDALLRAYCVDLMRRHPGALPHHQWDADLHSVVGDLLEPERDRRTLGRALARAFPGLGLTASQISADFAARLAALVQPDPEVTRLVAGLSDRYRLAVVSNGSGAVQRTKLAAAGLADLFTGVFISGELGVAKPAPVLYRWVLDWVGCRPSDVLFVGDDPVRDIAGAAAAGIATCWVSRGRAYPAVLPTPDLTIERIDELSGALR